MTPAQLRTKVALVRDNIERLAEIPQDTYATFAADFRNLDSALHRIQTSIQALIDIGSYVVAQLGLRPPSTSREVLSILEEAGALPVGADARFGPIVGFRNRVVHLDDRVDPQIVYRVLREDRGDLEALLSLLLEALRAAP